MKFNVKSKNALLFGLVLLISLFYSFIREGIYAKSSIADVSSESVMDVLIALGKEQPYFYMEKHDDELAQIGEELITKGQATYKGKRGKRISSYFQCTDCHSLKKETISLNDNSPDARLSYAIENKEPFYPGSTLHGLYNREKFYNDDYFKKYGELVFAANDSIENAIQLCAEYCASGRPLNDWELEAMMHYFKREELKMSELGLSNQEIQKIKNDLVSKRESSSLVELIESKYMQRFPASFTGTMNEEDRKYGEEGNALRGEKIYELSCMFCHGNSRVTNLDLGKDVLSGQYLWNNRKGYDDHSVYQVVRWGTYPKTGRQQYMPLYTKERMTDDQINDLMAYINILTNK
jgi:mono/diheme cytochrome c family protein